MDEPSPLTRIVAPDEIENHYEVTGECSVGGFGVLQLCRRIRRPVIKNVALKRVAKVETCFKDCVLREDNEEYQKLLLQFEHPNVMQYYDFLEDDAYAYIVIPPLSGPTLWTRLKKARTICEHTAQDTMLQILKALEYIHSRGIVHRDVNPGKLVYETRADDTLKLVDFSLCVFDPIGPDPNFSGSVVGTLQFVAPEGFSGFSTEALDTWSAGVIFHIMMVGHYPFDGDSKESLLAAIETNEGLDLSAHPWVELTSSCPNLVRAMLDIDPGSRITATEALEHEWFQVPRSDRPIRNSVVTEATESTDIPDGGNCEVNQDEIVLDILDLTPSMPIDPWSHALRQSLHSITNSKGLSSISLSKGLSSWGLSSSVPASFGTSQQALDGDEFSIRKVHTDVMEYQKTQTRTITVNDKANECMQIIAQAHLARGYAIARISMISRSTSGQLKNMMEGATKWDATVATFSINVGVSIIATPYAFARIGFAGIPLLCFFTFCTGFTAELMAWALIAQTPKADKLSIPREARDLSFLAEAAFGKFAKKILLGFIIVELFGYLTLYTVVIAVHINLFVEDVSKTSGVFVSSLITLLLCFIPQNVFTRLSILLNFVFLVTCGLFVTTGFMLPEKAPISEFKVLDPIEVTATAGILVFGTAAHACLPAIMQSMSEPKQYVSCIRQGYSAQLVFVLLIAVPGFLCFGNSLKESLVENIGKDRNDEPLPGLAWMGPFVAAGMVLKVSAMQPLIFLPFVQTLKTLMPDVPKLMVMVLTLVVSSLAAAVFADKLAVLFNLLGSVMCTNVAFVMPVACYWRLVGYSSCLPKRVGYGGLITMGICFAIFGVLSALGILGGSSVSH